MTFAWLHLKFTNYAGEINHIKFLQIQFFCNCKQAFSFRLLHPELHKFENLVDFVTKRSHFGCEQWLPVRVNAKDAILSVLPGKKGEKRGFKLF